MSIVNFLDLSAAFDRPSHGVTIIINEFAIDLQVYSDNYFVLRPILTIIKSNTMPCYKTGLKLKTFCQPYVNWLMQPGTSRLTFSCSYPAWEEIISRRCPACALKKNIKKSESNFLLNAYYYYSTLRSRSAKLFCVFSSLGMGKSSRG